MTQLKKAFVQFERHLALLRVPFALVGGLAVSVRTEPRFTRDIDLAVSVSGDSQAEEIVRFLTQQGYLLKSSVEQDATGRLATVRLISNAEANFRTVVDLLFASSGIEHEIIDKSEQLEIFESVFCPVAVTGHLIAVKILSMDEVHRPQDTGDIRALINVATETDLALARTSLRLIAERGYHRNRDLWGLFDTFLLS